VRDGNGDLTLEMIKLLFQSLDICRSINEDFNNDNSNNEIIKQFRDALAKFKSSESNVKNKSSLKNRDTSETTFLNKDIDSKNKDESTNVFKVEIVIESQGQEAYLKTILEQHKLEEIGEIIEIIPLLEQLKMIEEEFNYEVVLQTKKTKRIL